VVLVVVLLGGWTSALRPVAAHAAVGGADRTDGLSTCEAAGAGLVTRAFRAPTPCTAMVPAATSPPYLVQPRRLAASVSRSHAGPTLYAFLRVYRL
jgi:hypothetical protein